MLAIFDKMAYLHAMHREYTIAAVKSKSAPVANSSSNLQKKINTNIVKRRLSVICSAKCVERQVWQHRSKMQLQNIYSNRM